MPGPTDVSEQLTYLGYTQTTTTNEVQQAFNAYDHMLLLSNLTERAQIVSYLNVSNIPLQYRTMPYYAVNGNPIQNTSAYKRQLPPDHIFVRDRRLAALVLKLFSADVSPLLADAAALVGLPKTLVLVSERDEGDCKDAGLLYAQRLRESGVPTTVKYYPNGFHGNFGALYDNDPVHYATAVQMYTDLIDYLTVNL